MAVVKQSETDTFQLQADSTWPVRDAETVIGLSRLLVVVCESMCHPKWQLCAQVPHGVPAWCGWLLRLDTFSQVGFSSRNCRRGSICVKRRSALEWWSVSGSPPVQRKRKPSDWSPLAATRPLSSAARHASPVTPCSADGQVPGKGE